MTPEGLRRAAGALAHAERVVVSTGAGMSRESGIPTFRDAGEGLWARFDPRELATEEGFRSDPARVWSWYAYRRTKMRDREPHAGHRALVDLENVVPELTVVTQNIDGLHQRAGSRDVIELHGSILRDRCIDCRRIPDESEPVARSSDAPPDCGHCGSHLRPDVVWFGEMLPAEATERAWELAARCDLLLVVGTSGTVWPAAELPSVARSNGATIIEINPHPSELTQIVDVFLEAGAGTALPAILMELHRLRGSTSR